MNRIKHILHKFITSLVMLFCISFSSFAQIQNIEYFIDNDPGYGNATPMTISSGNEIEGLLSIDISSLSTGFHYLGIRAKNANGWGQTRIQSIYNLKSSANSVISNAEYFVDNDPGNGNGIALPITPATTVQGIIPLDLSQVSTGFHSIGFRCKTENGDWGQTRIQSVYCLKSSANAVISNVEYFVDNDPGKGNGTELEITPAVNVQGTFQLDLSHVATGFHTFGFRCKTENGDWGHTKIQSVYCLKSSANAVISNVEYFIDTDPGNGNGTALAITPATTVQGIFPIDFSQISTGFHSIGFRCKTENGDWGMTKFNSFYNLKTSASKTITNIEYFIDNDPGYGNAIAHIINPGQTIETSLNIDASTLSVGYHTLGVRCRTESGDWGLSFTQLFYKDDVSTDLIEVNSKDEMLSIVYPNPTTEKVFVKILNATSDVILELVNLEGKVLLQKTLSPNTDQILETLHVGNLENGTYLIITKSDQTVKTKKIIIKK